MELCFTYGEGENAKYALIDSGAYSYETTDYDTIDVSDRVHQYLLDHRSKTSGTCCSYSSTWRSYRWNEKDTRR